MSSDLDLFNQLQSFLSGEESTSNEIPEQERFGYDPPSDTIAQGVFNPNSVVKDSTPIATVENNNNNPNIQPTANGSISIGSEFLGPNAEPQLDNEHGLNGAFQGAEDIIADSEQNDDSSDFDNLFDDSLPAEVELPQVYQEPRSTEVGTVVNHSNNSKLEAPLEEGVMNEGSLSKQGSRHKSDGVASNLKEDGDDCSEFDVDLDAAFDTEFAPAVESDTVPSFETDLDAEMTAQMETELEAQLEAQLEAELETGFQQEMENETPQDQALPVPTSSPKTKKSPSRKNVSNPRNLGHDKVQPAVDRAGPSNGPISGNPVLHNIQNRQPPRPGSSPKVKKSSKRRRRVSNFPWIYNKHMEFSKDINALDSSANSGQDTGLDEDEDEDYDESLGSDDEELNPQSQDAGPRILIDLTSHDDEGAQDDLLPSNSVRNIQQQQYIIETGPPELGNPPVANYAPLPAPHNEAPRPSIPQETVIPKSQQNFAQNPAVENSTPPNHQDQSQRAGGASESRSSHSQMPDPELNTHSNATKRKAHQLEPLGSEEPAMEQQVKRPRNPLSTNEHPAPMNVNFHVHMGDQNMNPNLHMQIGQQNVNAPLQMQMGQQNANPNLQMPMGQHNVNINANMHASVSQEQVNASAYMGYRVPELKQMLKDRSIPRSGIKSILVKRLMEADIRRAIRTQNQLSMANQRWQPQNFGGADNYQSLPQPHSAHMMRNSNYLQQHQGEQQHQPEYFGGTNIGESLRSSDDPQRNQGQQQFQPFNFGRDGNGDAIPQMHSAHRMSSSNDLQHNQGQQQYQPQNFSGADDGQTLPQTHSAHMMRILNDPQHNQGQQQYQPLNFGRVGNDGSFPGSNPVQAMGAVSASLHHPQPRHMISESSNGPHVSTQMGLNNGTQSSINSSPVVATNHHSNPNNGGPTNVHGQSYQTWMANSFDGSANRLSQQPFDSTGQGYDNSGYQQPMYSGAMGHNPYGLLPQQPQQPQHPQHPQQSQCAPHGTPSGFIQPNSDVNRAGNLSEADMNGTMEDMMGWMDEGSPDMMGWTDEGSPE